MQFIILRLAGARRPRSVVVLGLLCFAMLVCSSIGAQAASDPPVLTVQPISQSVASGSNVVLNSAVTGTPPLSFQWLANGTNVPGATSNILTLKPVTILSAGDYIVVVTNVFGMATSDVARVTIDQNLTFKILALRTNGFVAFEVNQLTGDDRGGMAVSSNSVFLTGDNTTARWRKQDLSAGTQAGQQFN